MPPSGDGGAAGGAAGEAVARLWRAMAERDPVDLLSPAFELVEEAAYAVQEELVRRRSDALDSRVAGYKISATSPETQALVDISEPVYGTYLALDIHRSPAELVPDDLLAPLIEPEIVFHVTRDLPFGARRAEIREATTMHAGLEVPDSRFRDWFTNVRFTDLVCDNAVAGWLVVGDPLPTDAVSTDVSVRLSRDGRVVASGASSSVMGDPVRAVEWLVGKLAERGKRLREGMFVSSGTLAMPVAADAGTVVAVYDGGASVRLRITA